MFNRRKLSIYFLTALLSVIIGTSILSAADPGTRENVSQSEGNYSEAPQAAAFGTSLKVIWGDRQERSVVVKEKAIGGGWSGPATFAEGTLPATQFADIAVTQDGTTHIVYAVGNTIYHRSKPNNGGWSDRRTVAVDSFPNPVRMATAPNGTVWVVWRDTDGTRIGYRSSTDGGMNWTGDTVASQGGNMFAPDVAVGPDNVPHVVWYIRSGSGNGNTAGFADWTGTSWAVGDIGNAGGYVADPAITVGSNNVVHVAYRRQEGENWVIGHASRAAGQGWRHVAVNTTPGNAAYGPGIAADTRGGVHVTWSQLVSGGRDVFYSYSPAGGSFSEPQNVSERSPYNFNSRSTVVVTETGSGVIAHVFYQSEPQGNPTTAEIAYRPFTTATCQAPTGGGGTPANLPNKVYLPLVVTSGC